MRNAEPSPQKVADQATATPEIEVTPEMIEAGACIVACYSGREDDPADTAVEVFKAMIAAIPHGKVG